MERDGRVFRDEFFSFFFRFLGFHVLGIVTIMENENIRYFTIKYMNAVELQLV